MPYLQAHEEYQGLKSAYEAMIDIADYTNVFTGDHVMRQIIMDIQVNHIFFTLLELWMSLQLFSNLICKRQASLIGTRWNTAIWLSTAD